MSVISCPRCDEAVRVPESLSTESSTAPNGSVRCPWCRETLSVSDVIGSLPPMLEIVAFDDAVIDSAILAVDDEFGAFEPAEPQADFDEYHLSDPIQNAGSSISPVTRPVGASRGRSNANKGSGIGAVIKMALGGLLAVPIAATILSLVGKPLPIDLGFFPFQGDSPGSSSGRVVGGSPTRSAAQPRPLESSSRVDPLKSRVLSPVVQVDKEPDITSNGRSEADAALGEISGLDDSFEMPSSGGIPKVPIHGDVIPEVVIPENVVAEIAEPDMPSMELPELAAEEKLDADAESLESGRPVLSESVTTAITNANATLGEAIEIRESGVRDLKAYGAAYRAIAEVASVIDESTGASPEVASLLKRVASSSLAEMYSQNGRHWIEAKSRKTDGVLLIGETIVSDAETLIDFGDGNTLVVKYSDKLPRGRVAALGRIQSGTDEPLVELSAVQSVE